MKFSFIRIPTNPTPAFPKRYSYLAPLIPIRIINKSDHEKYIDINAMIDSGADVSIFPIKIAEKIKLDIDKKKVQNILGIEKHPFETYLHNIIIDVGGWQFNTYACFTSADIYSPVLGRKGFFDLFEIKFDLSKESIELKYKIKPLNA